MQIVNLNVRRLSSLLFVLLVVNAVAGADTAQGSEGKPLPVVPLKPVTPKFAQACASIAGRVAFSVPCPTRLPVVHGRPHNWSTLSANFYGTNAPYFLFDASGFDVPRGYRGVDGRRSGHVVIEAYRQSDGPAQPCFGESTGTASVADREVAYYSCASYGSIEAQRDARHGEGIFSGHVIGAWDQDGIRYVVSAHGHNAANEELVRRLIANIALREPPPVPRPKGTFEVSPTEVTPTGRVAFASVTPF